MKKIFLLALFLAGIMPYKRDGVILFTGNYLFAQDGTGEEDDVMDEVCIATGKETYEPGDGSVWERTCSGGVDCVTGEPMDTWDCDMWTEVTPPTDPCDPNDPSSECYEDPNCDPYDPYSPCYTGGSGGGGGGYTGRGGSTGGSGGTGSGGTTTGDPCAEAKALSDAATSVSKSNSYVTGKNNILSSVAADGNTPVEHSVTFGKDASGNITVSSVTGGNGTNGTVDKNWPGGFADFHNHNNYVVPSPGDFYYLVYLDQTHNGWNTRYVTTPDGSVYCLCLGDC